MTELNDHALSTALGPEILVISRFSNALWCILEPRVFPASRHFPAQGFLLSALPAQLENRHRPVTTTWLHVCASFILVPCRGGAIFGVSCVYNEGGRRRPVQRKMSQRRGRLDSMKWRVLQKSVVSVVCFIFPQLTGLSCAQGTKGMISSISKNTDRTCACAPFGAAAKEEKGGSDADLLLGAFRDILLAAFCNGLRNRQRPSAG